MNLSNDASYNEHDGYLARLADHNRNKISPISLRINCEALRQWGEKQDGERFRYQNLVKEIKLWSTLLARRPVAYLQLSDPFRLVDAPSLIDLVQAVTEHLKLPVNRQSERCVTLSLRDVNKQNVLLLGALKFNHIRLQTPPGEPLERVSGLIQKLGEFKIAHGSILIDNAQDEAIDKIRLMEILSFCKPETLAFGCLSPMQPLLQDPGLTPVLMQFGYYLQPDGIILRFRSNLKPEPEDVVSLGPGAQSIFGDLRLHNHTSCGSYYSCLNQSRLPFAAMSCKS